MTKQTTLDWSVLKQAASALGVTEKAFEKWRERKSVPHKWRLRINRWSKGRISLDAFEELDERA